MIKQQYYTRERKGIFSRTPGFDSVAISAGIDLKMLKDIIHSYCFYDAPEELLLNNAKEEEFPKSLCFFTIEGGPMMIGQAVFKSSDYTGQRNSFFMHNYIIPEEEKYNYLKSPEAIVYSGGFITEYDMEKGMELPEVNKIAYAKDEDCFENSKMLLQELKIDEEKLKAILLAVYMSVINKKKLYIVLEVEIQKLNYYSKALIKFILKALPIEIRKKVGFLTYTNKTVSKKGINIIFVEKASRNLNTIEAKSNYVISFEKNEWPKFNNEISYEFLDFLVNNLDEDKIINSYFEIMDIVLRNSEGILDCHKINEVFIFSKFIFTSEIDDLRLLFHLKSNAKEQFMLFDRLTSFCNCYDKSRKAIIEKIFYEEINIDNLSGEEEIIKLELPVSDEGSRKYELIACIKKFYSDASNLNIDYIEDKILSLENGYNIFHSFIVKQTGELIYTKNYRKLVTIFLLNSSISKNYNFYELFLHINKHHNSDEVYNFIIWCSDEFQFNETSESNFMWAIKEYFNEIDKKSLNNKNIGVKLYKIHNEKVVGLLKTIEYNNSSLLKKFWKKLK